MLYTSVSHVGKGLLKSNQTWYVNLSIDRCREPGLKWYGVHGHCKHYWSCVLREGGGAYAQSECCPDMGGFIEGEGCIENKNCTESCSSPILTGGPTGNYLLNIVINLHCICMILHDVHLDVQLHATLFF